MQHVSESRGLDPVPGVVGHHDVAAHWNDAPLADKFLFSRSADEVDGVHATLAWAPVAFHGAPGSRTGSTTCRDSARARARSPSASGRPFPGAEISFEPDAVRSKIVDSWPEDMDDSLARRDWGWKPGYDAGRAFAEYLIPTIGKRYSQSPPPS